MFYVEQVKFIVVYVDIEANFYFFVFVYVCIMNKINEAYLYFLRINKRNMLFFSL